jgi:uncharacterized protein YbaP (TraB family)
VLGGKLPQLRRSELAPVHFRSLRLRLALLWLVCWAGCGRAPELAQRDAARAQQAAPPPGLFLYAVQRDGRVSHLLGTIHLGFGFDEVLTQQARERFARSKQVITETELTTDSAARLMRAALLPPEQSLEQMLGAQSWQKLQARLGTQLPGAVLTHLRPWLPAVLLGIDDLKHALDQLRPGKSAHMMDLELTQQARSAGKSVRHLESVDEQIALFAEIPGEEQLSELNHALSSDSALQSRALVEAFASGDERALSSALFDAEQVARAPGFYKVVLFERNAHWLPVLEAAIAQGDAFVAVGAAHLLGDNGLLSELRQRGYAISRVH